jgi:hypothetical protein
MEIRRVNRNDWPELRLTRLRALIDAPDAFQTPLWVPETQFVAFKRHPLREKRAPRDRI